MLLDSDFTEEDKTENILRVREIAREIDQIIDLITDHMLYTRIAQHEVGEITVRTREVNSSID